MSSNEGPGYSRDTAQRIIDALFQEDSSGISGSGGLERLGIPGITPDVFRAFIGALARERSGGDDEEDEDDDDEDDWYYPTTARPWVPPVTTEPQEPGVKLLNGGEFGYVGSKHRAHPNHANVTRAILNAANKPSSKYTPVEETTTNLVPNTNGTTVATYDHNIYTAQFSDDSSFYYTCAQDFRLHIFDMTKPSLPFSQVLSDPSQRLSGMFSVRRSALRDGLATSLPLRKEIVGQAGNWTITDANLSPDNSRIIYSSIMSTVYMTNTSPEGSTEQIPIHFAERRGTHAYPDRFGIWSCRFSADGNEVVAGGSGNIFVYDLLADRRTVKIPAHEDDVNSCCWADTGSGNVLISASDDTFLKVWDRRSLGVSQKPSGVLIGHTEGITYVSAKGDGRYVISNGKDQALRLWDLRMMRSNEEFESVKDRHYGLANFDYRRSTYPKPRHTSHPQDCSVMTYRGHSVLRTLIRCHFSPAETTGGQYLYSGSADGRVHVWSLDGRIVQVLDRSRTLPSSFDPSGQEPREISRGESTCVRDVSWHSQEPVIMSAAWSNRSGGTVIARHEWKGLSKLRYKLEDWLQKGELEAMDSPPLGRRRPGLRERRHVPGSYSVSDDDDSDWVEE